MQLDHWRQSDNRKELCAIIDKMITQDSLIGGKCYGILSMCDAEIAAGESAQNEYELALSDLHELAEKHGIEL